MSETVQIWLFGILGAWLLGITITGMKMWIIVTQLKTMWLLTSKKAAEILHSPDDHHGLDTLLDKYIHREYELSLEDWQELRDKCEFLAGDITHSKDERILAAWLLAVATHKLTNKWSK